VNRILPIFILCGSLGAQPANAWFENVQLPSATQVSLFLIASMTKQVVMYVQKGQQGTWAKSIGLGVVIDSINAILIKEAASAISGAVTKKPKNEDCWRRNDELERENKALKSNSNTVQKSDHFYVILDANMHLISEKLKQRSRVYSNSKLEEEAARILADLLLMIGRLYPGTIQQEFYDSGKIAEAARRYGLSALLDKSFISAFNRILGSHAEYSDRKDYFNRLIDIIKSTADSDL
jgi:hypothetical protein